GVLMISDRTPMSRLHDLFFSSVDTRYCMVVRGGILRGMITRNDFTSVIRMWHLTRKWERDKLGRLVDRTAPVLMRRWTRSSNGGSSSSDNGSNSANGSGLSEYELGDLNA